VEVIALKGCIVTIDAMGCQYKIADQIVTAEADYLFVLKENQETLYEDVKTYFEGFDQAHPDPAIASHTTFDVDHGRLETRFYGITSDVSSLPPDPQLVTVAGRGHWGHYVLDMAYREDGTRIKAGEAPEYWTYFRKIAMTLARADRESKDSVKSQVKQMAWSDDYLERLLFHFSFASEVSTGTSSA
jgi:predicted transposase YbfD/YdcC